jgi:hypothetical protein
MDSRQTFGHMFYYDSLIERIPNTFAMFLVVDPFLVSVRMGYLTFLPLVTSNLAQWKGHVTWLSFDRFPIESNAFICPHLSSMATST